MTRQHHSTNASTSTNHSTNTSTGTSTSSAALHTHFHPRLLSYTPKHVYNPYACFIFFCFLSFSFFFVRTTKTCIRAIVCVFCWFILCSILWDMCASNGTHVPCFFFFFIAPLGHAYACFWFFFSYFHLGWKLHPCLLRPHTSTKILDARGKYVLIFFILFSNVVNYHKYISNSPTQSDIKSCGNLCFKLNFFFVKYFAIKNSTDWWNFFSNGKGGKYHSPKKQPFLSEISLYNLGVAFYLQITTLQFYNAKSGKYHSPKKHHFPL